MKTIGITGSVAMGKSTVVKMLRYLRHPVFDADAAVADLYLRDKELNDAIAFQFPDTLDVHGKVCKQLLAKRVFANDAERQALEAIIHPRVFCMAKKFHHQQRCLRRKIIFWDVPLLFQSPLQCFCDEIWVVTCSDALQHRRALRRPHWDVQRFETIRSLQVPARTQRLYADRLIMTGVERGTVFRELKGHLRCVSRETRVL